MFFSDDNGDGDIFHCGSCNLDYPSLEEFISHKNSMEHLQQNQNSKVLSDTGDLDKSHVTYQQVLNSYMYILISGYLIIQRLYRHIIALTLPKL